LTEAAAMVREAIGQTLAHMGFPRERWRSLRSNNPLERIIRKHLSNPIYARRGSPGTPGP